MRAYIVLCCLWTTIAPDAGWCAVLVEDEINNSLTQSDGEKHFCGQIFIIALLHCLVSSGEDPTCDGKVVKNAGFKTHSCFSSKKKVLSLTTSSTRISPVSDNPLKANKS